MMERSGPRSGIRRYPCVFYADWFGTKYKDKGRDGKAYEIDLATVITIGGGGGMWLEVGKSHANGQYRDALGNMGGTMVDINADGWGKFPVSGGSISVRMPA